MILKIDSKVYDINLTPYYRFVEGAAFEFFDMPPGKNHCKLLAYLSQQLPLGSRVADLGTLYGQSATALASNPYVEVWTFDTHDQLPRGCLTIKDLQNVRFFNADCKEYIKQLVNFSIIFLDIAPHDGIQEQEVLSGLMHQGFRGLLICDDIFYSDAMETWWRGVPLQKYNVTNYGHWSGTGIVVFDPQYIDVEITP